jgi:hypothetical protein
MRARWSSNGKWEKFFRLGKLLWEICNFHKTKLRLDVELKLSPRDDKFSFKSRGPSRVVADAQSSDEGLINVSCSSLWSPKTINQRAVNDFPPVKRHLHWLMNVGEFFRLDAARSFKMEIILFPHRNEAEWRRKVSRLLPFCDVFMIQIRCSHSSAKLSRSSRNHSEESRRRESDSLPVWVYH